MKNVERRRGRRVELEAPVLIRRAEAHESQNSPEQITKNISLGGLYFETDQTDGYHLNEALTASIAIDESQRREFPFTRLVGPTRIVRVDEVASSTEQGKKQFGIALEFGKDLMALTASPLRS